MKVRKIRLVVKPWKDIWAKEKKIARRLDRHDGAPVSVEETLYFSSLEELRQVLTDKRLKLLRLIHAQKPSSIKALAAAAGRDFKNVNADVHLLARLGLLDLTEEGTGPKRRGRKPPRVPYTAVSVEIPLA